MVVSSIIRPKLLASALTVFMVEKMARMQTKQSTADKNKKEGLGFFIIDLYKHYKKVLK